MNRLLLHVWAYGYAASLVVCLSATGFSAYAAIWLSLGSWGTVAGVFLARTMP